MKSILDIKSREKIIERLNNLEKNSLAKWGKMNASEMLCHCNDQIKLGLGEYPNIEYNSLPFSKLFVYLVFLGIPTPKGKIETFNEIKQGAGGTKPTTFENDKRILIKSIREFEEKYPNGMLVKHPAFGKLSKFEWGKLTFIHLDHHLKQFNQ